MCAGVADVAQCVLFAALANIKSCYHCLLLYKLGVVAWAEQWYLKVRGQQVRSQGHNPWLHVGFEASMGYMKPCLKKKNRVLFSIIKLFMSIRAESFAGTERSAAFITSCGLRCRLACLYQQHSLALPDFTRAGCACVLRAKATRKPARNSSGSLQARMTSSLSCAPKPMAAATVFTLVIQPHMGS